MTQRKSISELAKAIKSCSRSEFFAQYGCPFLVQVTQDGRSLEGRAQQSLVDSKSRRLSLDYLKTKIETQAFLRLNFAIIEGNCLPIRNASSNQGRSFIGLGSDGSCDLLLTEASVAERHGFFKLKPSATFTHAGAGSTQLNGMSLAPRKTNELNNHDLLEFGPDAAYIYLAPHGAYDFFVACARASAIPEVQLYP